jgi:hypothetical protein
MKVTSRQGYEGMSTRGRFAFRRLRAATGDRQGSRRYSTAHFTRICALVTELQLPSLVFEHPLPRVSTANPNGISTALSG